ncbi:MAG: hypothetical protein WEA10_00150 [Actinomycetota bacterium]
MAINHTDDTTAVRRVGELDAGDDPLLDRYLAKREQVGDGEPEQNEELPPGHEWRNCANCGAWAIHKLDPDGTWFECSECGKLA